MKKFQALCVLLLLYNTIISSNNHALESVEFPQYTTDKYLYTKKVNSINVWSLMSLLTGCSLHEGVTYDQSNIHYFNNGVTRKKITVTRHDNIAVITTETWTTLNPSYLTGINASIALGSVGFCLAALQGFKIHLALNNPFHQEHEYWIKLKAEILGVPISEQYFIDIKKEQAAQAGRNYGQGVQNEVEKLNVWLEGFIAGVSPENKK
jgi:hypothetical protein